MHVPKHIILKKLPLNTKGFEAKNNRSLCVGCNYLIKDNVMYDIPLNIIIKFFEDGKEPSEQGDSVRENKNETEGADSAHRSDCVPKVVKRLNPIINNAKYEEMKNNSNWDHLQAKVCQDCFLHFTEYYSTAKKPTKIKININTSHLPTETQLTTFESRSQTPPPPMRHIKHTASEKIIKTKELPLIKPMTTHSKKKLIIQENTRNSDLKLIRPIKSKIGVHIIERYGEKTFEKNNEKNIEKPSTSSLMNAVPIYRKFNIVKNKPISSIPSTSYSRNNGEEAGFDFIQDTLQVLKHSILKLST